MATRDLIFTILGIDRASPAFNSVARSVDHAERKLDSFGKISGAALGGTVAAAAAAGVGIAAALGGATALFAGLGIAAASSNTQVADSFTDLWGNIKAGTRDAAAPLVPMLVGISGQLQSTFDQLQPRLERLFTGTIPAIRHMTDGLTRAATEAMPGLEAAVASSEPVFASLEDVMVDVGKGSTDFFLGISKGSESSGQILRVFGGIAREALGFTGDLLARLSNEGAPAVERLGQVFAQLLGVITQLSSGALPVLFGAAGVAFDVLSGLLTVVGGLSGVLGPLTGVVISAAASLKLIDMVTFGAVSGQFGKLKANISEAQGLAGKLKVGLGGLLVGFGPLGFAAAGLGVILGELGERQQRAAQKAAEHRARVDSLTQALVASKNVVTDQIAQDQIRTGQQQKLYETADQIGVSHQTMTQALLGNRDAIDLVNRAWDTNAPAIDRAGTAAEKMGGKFNILGMEGAKYTSTQRSAFGELSGAMLESQDAADGIIEKQREAGAAADEHTAALVRLQEQLLGIVNQDLAYRQAVNAEREAQEKAAEAVKKHGVNSDEATQAMFGWEQAAVRAVATAGELATSQYLGSDASEAARLKMEAQNREIIRLAELSGNNAPLALRQMIAGMDASALAALGVTVRVNAAGQSVYRLPNGKEIVLTAEDQASAKIAAIKRMVDSMTTFKRIVIQVQQQLLGAFGIGRESGGPIRAGRPYIVGEKGPELIFPAEDGFVANAAQTRRIMAGARTDSVHRIGGGGRADKHYHLTVYNAGNTAVDLRAQFERMELLSGM